MNGFIVKPNELVRERPYIEHNIAFTRQAYGLDRIVARQFPAETTVEAADPAGNAATLQNIRLWDWRVLQDTLRQLQEIRTYYDFPDIDIDRYTIDGAPRQVMLATRELNVEKLPVSSRNWINEKLIYTHGYGMTMNYVNGFTPEGLPQLLLKDMPVQSAIPGITVTRPEIYFGEMTDTDVYVNTRQQEFNYPQGQNNSVTSYQGAGRHRPRRRHPPAADRDGSRRHRQAAVQRRRHGAEPAVDAAQRARAGGRARAVPDLRRRSRTWSCAATAGWRGSWTPSPFRTAIPTRAHSRWKGAASTTCATASRW